MIIRFLDPQTNLFKESLQETLTGARQGKPFWGPCMRDETSPQRAYGSSTVLEYIFLDLFLKGTIINSKSILFSPWLLQSPVPPPILLELFRPSW